MTFPFPDNRDGTKHIKGVRGGNATRYFDIGEHRRLEGPQDGTQCQEYLHELHEIQSLLNSVLAVIRCGTQEEVIGLLECIRSEASLSEIRFYLLSLARFSQATGRLFLLEDVKDPAKEEDSR